MKLLTNQSCSQKCSRHEKIKQLILKSYVLCTLSQNTADRMSASPVNQSASHSKKSCLCSFVNHFYTSFSKFLQQSFLYLVYIVSVFEIFSSFSMSFTDCNHFSMSLSLSYWNITGYHCQKAELNILLSRVARILHQKRQILRTVFVNPVQIVCTFSS